MKLILPMGKDQTEQHFLIMIYLMLAFFAVNIGLELLDGVKPQAVSVTAINTAHDAFLAFFGIAIGMFRGMVPQGAVNDTSNPAARTIVTTDVHSEKDIPASVVPEPPKEEPKA